MNASTQFPLAGPAGGNVRIDPVTDAPNVAFETLEIAATIRLVCFDVDGVLTDGCLWYAHDGEALKAFHVHDGLGLKLLKEAGIEVAIVSARRSAAVTARMADLGIARVHQGVADKLACVAGIARELGIELDAAAFVGDDLPDAEAMCSVGLAIAVANARAPVLAIARYATRARGGDGAVREVCDLLLAAQAARLTDDMAADGTVA